MKNISEKDDLLAKKIANTLDDSLEKLDEVSARRLQNARAAAMAQTSKTTRPASKRRPALGIAAGFALVLITSLVWQHQTVSLPEQDIEMALQEIPPSAEELDDMDMLMALEDTDV